MENKNRTPLKFAWQLFLRAIIAAFLSMFICFTCSALMENSLEGKIFTGLVTVGFSGVLIYLHAWSVGDLDANAIQFGRAEKDPWKGLKAALLLTLFLMSFSIPLALSMLKILPFDFMPFYRLLDSPFWPIINIIHPYGAIAKAEILETETTVYQAATAGLTWGKFWLISILPALYIPFTVIGYSLGLKRFSISQKVVYKSSGKENKK